MRMGATPEEVDAFMAAIGRGDLGWREAPQADGAVFWLWRCPAIDDGLHHGRVQYVTTDLGSTPVCLDCGNAGPVRSGPLFTGLAAERAALRNALDENGNPYR